MISSDTIPKEYEINTSGSKINYGVTEKIDDDGKVNYLYKSSNHPSRDAAMLAVVKAKLEKENTNQEALRYLADTDYMVIRAIDGGVGMTAEVKALRADARLRIL